MGNNLAGVAKAVKRMLQFLFYLNTGSIMYQEESKEEV